MKIFGTKIQVKWDDPSCEMTDGSLPRCYSTEYWQEPVLKEKDVFPTDVRKVISHGPAKMPILQPLTTYRTYINKDF